MTEEGWLACTDPGRMLRSVRWKGRWLRFWAGRQPSDGTDRRLRLLACACCRRVLHVVPDGRIQYIVWLSEEFADGRVGVQDDTNGITVRELLHIKMMMADEGVSFYGRAYEGRVLGNGIRSALRALTAIGDELDAGRALSAAAAAAGWSQASDQLEAADGWLTRPPVPIDPAAAEAISRRGERQERTEQAHLVRDVFGNPFQPVSADPAWLTSAVLDLARQMYEARDFAPMPILADALQDAGCDDADILAHCRGPGPHVRGCWVVDRVLGKR